ncbi:MAG: precorrin-6A reductase [Syntrophales bacterium]
MILLIGGTSETAPLASGIARAGYEVLVSQATDTPLTIGEHPRISRRAGRLDEAGLIALARERGIRAIVDASHPYAVAAHAAAQNAATRLGIPCLRFSRPEGHAPERLHPDSPSADETLSVRFAADHGEAAALAFGDGRPVLVTTGSRNLTAYAEEARRTGVSFAVRVLDTPESLAACREAGIAAERIVAGRGPFTFAENIETIRRFGIGVIVTKESGRAGGFDAKLAAARETHCRVVVLSRPEPPAAGPVSDNPAALIAALRDLAPL